VNNDGNINYTEFLAATLECNGRIEQHRLAEAFDQLDNDCSGDINRDDLRMILGPTPTDAYIDTVIAEVVGDGKIDYQHFLTAFAERSPRKNSLAGIEEGNEEEAAAHDVLAEHGIIDAKAAGEEKKSETPSE
jgi:hypothetical protein